MTDPTVIDLSFGHLGEASYDTQLQKWSFSRLTGLHRSILSVEPLRECIPSSISTATTPTHNLSKDSLIPIKWLRKELPETETSIHLLSSLSRLNQETDNARWHHTSRLLAVGQAVDLLTASEARNLQILAIPHGEAGEILRLLKPRISNLKWGNHKGISLRTINPAVSEDGYWLGDGGAIQQIVFGVGLQDSSSWLAVRKAAATTILRPVYHPFAVPYAVPNTSGVKLPPSRLSPNAVLTLSAQKTGHGPHADVAFNPWYVRQFAVIDEGGFWSIWDIEGQERKRRTFEPIPGKSGHIYDDNTFNQVSDRFRESHEWARLLWAGSSSTLVVCNRHHLAVFDLRKIPSRLRGSDIFSTTKTGWILELKRSPLRLDHIFVLTTSHLLWLEIIPADESNDSGTAGARVLLSCRHFRNGEDDAMKLELMKEEEVCIALVYSAMSPVVNTYNFSTNEEDATAHHCVSNAFNIATIAGRDSTTTPIQDLAVIPASFIESTRSEPSGPGSIYHDEGTQFYQLIGLHTGLSLSQALCVTVLPSIKASNGKKSMDAPIEIPTINVAFESKKVSSYRVEDDFIVPDGLEDPEDYGGCGNTSEFLAGTKVSRRRLPHQKHVLSFNASRIFDLAFPYRNSLTSTDQTGESSTMADYIHNIAQSMEDRWTHAVQGSHTALELSGFDSFSEDVDEAAAALRELLENFGQEEQDEDHPLSLGLYTVKHILSDGRSVNEQRDLSKIYDQLVESWISCLPHNTPGPVRLAKDKLIRFIAAELCLSSQIVSLFDKSAEIPKVIEESQEEEPDLPVHGHPGIALDLSSLKYESQESSSELPGINRGLLTPAQTPSAAPSVVSQDTSVYSDGPGEDGAIARLRNYAISIKSQRSLGTAGSSLLAHWPSTPGSDPDKYSWEATNRALGKDTDFDSDEEEKAKRRKEAERRRRQTEKFLSRQRAEPLTQPLSQRIIPTFGSDPAGPPVASSSQLPTFSYPMSQPVTGAFGSRNAQKKPKKRRTKGF